MDDSFLKAMRLNMVLNRVSVVLDLRSEELRFHSCAPVNRIEWDLVVKRLLGTRKLSLRRVEYVWNDEFVLNMFWKMEGSIPLWYLNMNTNTLSCTSSNIGSILFLMKRGKLGLRKSLFVTNRTARFCNIKSLSIWTLYVLPHISLQ